MVHIWSKRGEKGSQWPTSPLEQQPAVFEQASFEQHITMKLSHAPFRNLEFKSGSPTRILLMTPTIDLAPELTKKLPLATFSLAVFSYEAAMLVSLQKAVS